jgi:hypothetical protein
MDIKAKKNIFQQNKKLFEYVFVKYIKYNRPIKYVYNYFFEERMKNTQFDKFAVVDVVMSDPLTIAKQFVENGMHPVILSTIDLKFDGIHVETSDKIYDDTLLFRSNYYRTLHSSDIFPINEHDALYTQYLFAIRDSNMNTFNNGFYFSVITTTLTKQTELYEQNLSSSNFLSTIQKIKTVFQLAYVNNHDVLILPLFGLDANYPIDNIVTIYNNCILEFGHLFKFIVISVPNQVQMQEMYLTVANNIVKPHTYLLNNTPEINTIPIPMPITPDLQTMQTMQTMQNTNQIPVINHAQAMYQ